MSCGLILITSDLDDLIHWKCLPIFIRIGIFLWKSIMQISVSKRFLHADWSLRPKINYINIFSMLFAQFFSIIFVEITHTLLSHRIGIWNRKNDVECISLVVNWRHLNIRARFYGEIRNGITVMADNSSCILKFITLSI